MNFKVALGMVAGGADFRGFLPHDDVTAVAALPHLEMCIRDRTYTLGADGIYYPNLVSTDEEPHYGKYGIMRKTYLKEHRPAMYSLYMLEDRLTEHLNAVDNEAQERMGILVRQMMEKQGVTEELKARDQMVWVGAVNNIRNEAEEIVLKELVYI